MSLALYGLVEGVTDAALVGKLLRVHRGAAPVRALNQLPEPVQGWLLRSFKWPHNGNIERPSVPVPKLYTLPDGRVVAVANAEGVTRMQEVAEADSVALDLAQVKVAAYAVIGDADIDLPSEHTTPLAPNEDPRAARLKDLLGVLRRLTPNASTLPSTSGEVIPGPPALGVLTVPQGPGLTVDTILEQLGAATYPALHAAATHFVTPWDAEESPGHQAHRQALRELRKPAGAVKARLAAMGALLKPMKSFSTSLDDHDWVSKARLDHPELQPLTRLIDELLR